MNRVKTVARMRQSWLAVLFGGLLVAAGFATSGANFSSTTANPSNTFSGGVLTHSNSKDGSAILTATKMKPGQSVNGNVIITNTGDIPGTFSLNKSALSDTPGANGGALSGKLDLLIEDITGAPTTVYSGKLDVMGNQALGSFAVSEARTYKFTVTFPDGGAPGSDTTGDNAYQGSSMSVQYDWTSVS